MTGPRGNDEPAPLGKVRRGDLPAGRAMNEWGRGRGCHVRCEPLRLRGPETDPDGHGRATLIPRCRFVGVGMVLMPVHN